MELTSLLFSKKIYISWNFWRDRLLTRLENMNRIAETHILWLGCVQGQHHEVHEGVRTVRVFINGLLQGTLGLLSLALPKEAGRLSCQQHWSAGVLIYKFLVNVIGVLQLITALSKRGTLDRNTQLL